MTDLKAEIVIIALSVAISLAIWIGAIAATTCIVIKVVQWMGVL